MLDDQFSQQPGFSYQAPQWNSRPAQQNANITPEVAQALLALNQQQSQQAKLERQMQMAQTLRAQSLGGAKATSPGGGRVGAPNWAGTLANVYAAKKAGDMERENDTRSSNMDTQRQDALRRYFEALTGNKVSEQSAGRFPGGEGE